MHPKGYYIYQAREKSAKRTVITNKMYYEGTMQALDRAMVASGAGLLITKDSIYKGYFVKGAAHGKGTLSLINAVVF